MAAVADHVAVRTMDGAELTTATAAAHIFKAVVGAGVFFLPVAVKSCGWGVAIILGSAMTALVIDNTRMVIRCRAVLDKLDHDLPASPTTTDGSGPRSALASMCLAVLGQRWSTALKWSLVVMQLCWCLIYVQLAAGMFAEIVGVGPASATYMLLCFAVGALIFPATLLSRQLEFLGAATYISISMFVIVATWTIIDVGGIFVQNGVAPTAVFATSPTRWIGFVPMMLSSLAGLAATIPVHDAMPKEKQGAAFERLYTIVTSGVGVLFMAVGICGYLTFGDVLTASIVSLERGAGVRTALALSVMFTAPIHFVPAIEIVDAEVHHWRRKRFGDEAVAHEACAQPAYKDRRAIANRVLLVGYLAIIAAGVGADTIGVIVSFIGATLVNGVELMLPMIIYLRCALLPCNDDANRDVSSYGMSLPADYVAGDAWSVLPWVAFDRARRGVGVMPRLVAHGRFWVYLAFSVVLVVQGTYRAFVDLNDVIAARK